MYSTVKTCVQHKFHTSIDGWPCPACSQGCQSLHVDGNFKLFTYMGTWKRAQPDPGLMSSFFPDPEVTAHRDRVDTLLEKRDARAVRPLPTHTSRAWQPHSRLNGLKFSVNGMACRAILAARRGRRARTTQNCTRNSFTPGACSVSVPNQRVSVCDYVLMCGSQRPCVAYAGTCPHEVVVGGVNIIQSGEQYAYAHYLLLRVLTLGVAVRCVHMDIACLWSPWALKVHDMATPDEQGLAPWLMLRKLANEGLKVSEMHSKIHSADCQVLDGQAHSTLAGREDGEQGERIHAPLSKQTNTRSMAPTGEMETAHRRVARSLLDHPRPNSATSSAFLHRATCCATSCAASSVALTEHVRGHNARKRANLITTLVNRWKRNELRRPVDTAAYEENLREREQDSDEDEPRVQHHRTAKLLCSYYLA